VSNENIDCVAVYGNLNYIGKEAIRTQIEALDWYNLGKLREISIRRDDATCSCSCSCSCSYSFVIFS
jgi:hypothetical protein